MSKYTANTFTEELKSDQSDAEKVKIRRYFKSDNPKNRVIGVRMKTTFELAKEYSAHISLEEIKKLLESPYYECRMGAVSIMDFQVRSKKVNKEYRSARFELYLNLHHHINNWDFVDRAAPRVIGSFLYDYNIPRNLLYNLASSDDPWERRTAIVSTAWFIKNGDLEDTFKIAELLLDDPHEYVQKAVGSWVRHAGKQDTERLLKFLELHITRIKPGTLMIMMEHLNKKQKEYIRNLKSKSVITH